MAYSAPANSSDTAPAKTRDAGAVHAYSTLHFGFALIPILAGADKFFDVLTNWDQYLAPVVSSTTHILPHTFMQIVGVVEIIAGILVAVRPRVGAYVVAAWLVGIIVNLSLNPVHYWDVAARDFGLFLGAMALGSLSAWVAARR
jgi:hypothetical protein